MIDQNVFLSPKQLKKIREEKEQITSIVHSITEYSEGETFEQLIEKKFAPYYGKTIYQIQNQLGIEFTSSPKAISNAVVHGILGVKSSKIEEFEKADIQQKTLRIKSNGRLKEAMSFSQIQYDDLMLEEIWEDSVWYNTLTKKFLFIVFRKSDTLDNKDAVLEKVFFWTMPYLDLQKAKLFWQDTRDKVRRGVFNQFMTSLADNICHVRPKAKDSKDLMPTRFGLQKKMAYWLNRQYIFEIVSKHL